MKMTERVGTVAWEVTKKYPFGDFEYATHAGTFRDAGGTDIAGITPVNNLRFPGQYDGTDVRRYLIQGAKGPYYNWHRWYNPGTGRYLSMDPDTRNKGTLLSSLAAVPGLEDARFNTASFNGNDFNPYVVKPNLFQFGYYGYSRGNPLMFYDVQGLDIHWGFIIMYGSGFALCAFGPPGVFAGGMVIIATGVIETAYYTMEIWTVVYGPAMKGQPPGTPSKPGQCGDDQTCK